MRNLAKSFQKWRRIRATMNELYGLSDRELSDLGISRADIPRISRDAV